MYPNDEALIRLSGMMLIEQRRVARAAALRLRALDAPDPL
jgi:hypothetical protein